MLRRLAGAYAVAVLLFALWVCLRAVREHYTLLYIDDWRIFDELFAGSLWPWLFASQNGHRMPATLLLAWLDYEHLGGRMQGMVVGMLVCAFAAVPALGLGFLQDARRRDPLAVAALAFAGLLLFWSGASYAFLWGMMHGNYWAKLWAFLALSLLVVARGAWQRGERSRSLRLVCAGAGAGALATFGHGAGFAVWPALLGVAFAARLPGRAHAVLAGAALLAFLGYAGGVTSHPRISPGASLAALGSRPLALPVFVAALLGSVPGHAARGLGAAGGKGAYALALWTGAAALLAWGAFGLRLRIRRARAGPHALLGFGLMTFGVGVAALVGGVRLAFFPPDQALAPRFLNWSAVFWMGAALAAATLPALRAHAGLALSALAALSLLLLPALGEARADNARRRNLLAKAGISLLLGMRQDPLAAAISLGHPETVHRVGERLRRVRRSVFAGPWAGLPGRALRERFAPVPGARCRGAAATEALLPGAGDGAARVSGARVSGWAWDVAADRAPRVVLVADAAGIVRGLGHVKEPGRPARTRPGRAPWSGFVAGADRDQAYRAFAVVGDGRTACPLPGGPLRLGPPAGGPGSGP